ncbi:MAG: peptidoglycan-binding protein [Clostridiales bacterium]
MAQPKLPIIPEYITVHLGKPQEYAPNVQVSFADYIKNVASSEIYPTWPENAIRANIYAQISFALNRIYTEWYTSRGYDFDITNSTQFDQAYVQGRDIFGNISRIVDEIFNDYVKKRGSVEPYFTQFCNGTTVTCPGLSQWGTVYLAQKGYTPYEILQHYYGNNIDIVQNAPVQKIEKSYPGIPLRLGMGGNEIRTIQTQLNRIRGNFPSVTYISSPNGVFGLETEKAVKSFQQTFNLTPDGIVGKATWYKIKEIYNGVKQLSELSSEGLKLEEITPIFITELHPGSQGDEVKFIQYYLSVIGYFNPNIPLVEITGYYGPQTTDSVKNFQSQYGLPVTGNIDRATWNRMDQIYRQMEAALQPGYEGQRAEIYPGYILKKGISGQNVADLQKYLAYIAKFYKSIPEVPITGYFGDQTERAIRSFQKEFQIPQSGSVGIVTWAKIAEIYDQLKGF